MKPAHQELHLQTLEVVSERLQAVHREMSNFSSLLKSSSSTDNDKQGTSRRSTAMNRTLYAFRKKNNDESISELEKWQSTFDISWLLILKVADQTMGTDEETSTAREGSPKTQKSLLGRPNFMAETGAAVFLRPDGIDLSNASPITYFESRFLTRGSERYILDTLICSQSSKASRSLVTRDVKSLAQRLHAYEGPGRGLFKCKGVLRQEHGDESTDQLSLTFVFKIPTRFQGPQSMREMLLGGQTSRFSF